MFDDTKRIGFVAIDGQDLVPKVRFNSIAEQTFEVTKAFKTQAACTELLLELPFETTGDSDSRKRKILAALAKASS